MKKELFLDENAINYKVERQVRVGDILVDVPLKYRCRAINLFFPISTKKAKEIIKTQKIKPLEIFFGKSLLCITLFDFYSGPVGHYTEIALSIPVSYNSKLILPLFSLYIDKLLKKISFFVFSIAQSTKIAIEHGLAITGYPRYSTDKLINVNFRDDGEFVYAEADGEGKKILRIKIRKPQKERLQKEIYPTYFVKDNKISSILMETYVVVGKSKVCNFELGNHELATRLKKLKLIPKSIDTRYYRDTIKIVHSPKVLESL